MAALAMLLILGGAGYYVFGYNVGTLRVLITDDAIRDFDSLNITFSEVQIHGISAFSTTPWVTVTLTTTTLDLTKLSDNVSEQIGLSQVPAGKYTQLRIVVLAAEGELKSGEHVVLTVPGGDLRTETPFEMEPQGSATILVRLLVVGARGNYTLQPALGSIVTGP